MRLSPSQSELVIAWALWEAGIIRWADAMLALERAEKTPEFRCQDFRNWPDVRAKYRCFCGEALEPGEMPPCGRCLAERAQLYEPTGRRRVFQIER